MEKTVDFYYYLYWLELYSAYIRYTMNILFALTYSLIHISTEAVTVAKP